MNLFQQTYQRSIYENERQRTIWNEQLNSLKSLNLTIFKDKLTVPSLIPIGNRILFKGELIHTNEVTVSLGADYFVKCSVFQAEKIIKHRISVAEEKIKVLEKEREYLENNLSFSNKNVWEETGKEIIEPYDEAVESEWKTRHRENVRKDKIQEKHSKKDNLTDVDLWERLEELELQEELENECDDNSSPSKIISAKSVLKTSLNNKSELLNRLNEIKIEDVVPCHTEEDVFKRLDQLEEQEELEEELDRLDDYESDSTFEDAINSKNDNKKNKKSLTFASDDDSIEISFKHSDVEPLLEGYDKNKGITKPSDIYEAFPQNFNSTEVTSILKKTDYSKDIATFEEPHRTVIKRVDVLGDIQENLVSSPVESKVTAPERPPSKFKLMRSQKRS